MPDELRKTRACNLVINQYRTSFQVCLFKHSDDFFNCLCVSDADCGCISLQEIIAFENASKSDPKVLGAFTETLYQMRERHANIVPTMAEAVMEVKSNYKEQGISLTFDRNVRNTSLGKSAATRLENFS